MSIGLRHVAPAGAPIRFGDLGRWARLGFSSVDASNALQRVICDRFGVPHAFLTSSGRAGLTMVLRAFRRLQPNRHEVVIPSYTCFSVAAAVVKAGLRPRVADIAPETLDYASSQLREVDFGRVLAIVATNLYGLPNDLASITTLARERGVFVIDDAAQAMGAFVSGRWSGTWGDAGIFSFDKGKNVSAIAGGAVLTSSNDIAAAVASEVAQAGAPDFRASAALVAKALSSFVLLRPWLYWIPNNIPQLELGKTVYSTEFPVARPGRALASLGRVMMDRLDQFTDVRRGNAAALLEALQDVRGVHQVTPASGARPVYPRLPILFDDENARMRALERLNASGIGATASYPTSIADIPQLRDAFAAAPQAAAGRHVARHILTLPTHPFVTARDRASAISAIADEAVESSPAIAIPTS